MAVDGRLLPIIIRDLVEHCSTSVACRPEQCVMQPRPAPGIKFAPCAADMDLLWSCVVNHALLTYIQ